MLNCLVLYHLAVTSLTKIMILRAIFLEEDFEIQVVENRTVMIYLWNVKDTLIRETIECLESTNICVGHGLGKVKNEALMNAIGHLESQQCYQQIK